MTSVSVLSIALFGLKLCPSGIDQERTDGVHQGSGAVPGSGPHGRGPVKSPGVVCDGYRVIFMSGQALSVGMVGCVVTS
ncbi:hypothetical protein, partial [Modestobacter lapidis]